MHTKASDAVIDYQRANGFSGAERQERLPFRQALPVWLGLAAGGWLVIALLFELLIG
jgi:hypothetical protein